MRFAAIVVTKDRPRALAAALAALAAQERRPDDIVVVDASLTPCDDVVARFRAESGAPALRHLRAAPGICAQRNLGIEETDADILFFVDDDALLPPSYCSAVMERFEADAAATLAGVAGLQERGRRHGAMGLLFRRVFLLQTDRGRNNFRSSGIPDFGFRVTSDTDVAFLASTAVAFRRSAIGDTRFDDAGLSGAAMGINSGRCFAEDVLFSRAVSARGALLLLPALRFRHEESTEGRDDAETTRALYTAAMRRVSALEACAPWRRVARAWALGGLLLMSAMQSIARWDAGYVRGCLRALRVALPR